MANQQPPLSTGAKAAVGALITLCAVLVLALLSVVFGNVSGEEFNPYTFQRRHFYYFELPLLHIQVWPLTRQGTAGRVEELVQANKYVVAKPSDPEAWHLMSFRRSSAASPPFDAAILKTYLDANNAQGHRYWHDWSERNASLAAVLWPEVARLSRLNLYVFLPHLFGMARTADDAKQLRTDVVAAESQWLHDQAKEAVEAQQYDFAVAICTAALDLKPGEVKLLQLRAAAYRELGEPDKAARDTAQAQGVEAPVP